MLKNLNNDESAYITSSQLVLRPTSYMKCTFLQQQSINTGYSSLEKACKKGLILAPELLIDIRMVLLAPGANNLAKDILKVFTVLQAVN